MCTPGYRLHNHQQLGAQDGHNFGAETLSISNGFRKAKHVSKDGWNGMLVFGKGPSSLRVRAGAMKDDGADSEADATSVGASDADFVLRAEVV
jgi:hypothetical protein